ncbi:MAG: class F sortase, partial [Acidimicrobiales bacterium]
MASGPSAVPVHLAIPALKVAAAVVPVSAGSGSLGVPRSISQVGWWAGGGVPGAPTGTVVIDGHVDSATRGLGALWALRFAQLGDQITLTLANGDSVVYRVRGLRVYLKAELPASLFAGVKGTAV